jgi:flagellar biosynthesis protein FlhG
MLDHSTSDVRPEPVAHAAARSARAARPTIWAVASGKGGVGKSVIGSSLAIGLSQTGPRAVAVDLDLGGANLHTLLGCERARHTLGDFAHGRVASLEHALAETSVPGVRLLSGARAGLDLASDQRAQNRRVLRELAQIDAGNVVLDLGAGTGPHTIDAFLAADRRLLVVTPERTAIENAYHFLSAAFFRAFREVARELAKRDALAAILEQVRRRGATPREMVEAASRIDARAGDRLRALLRAFEIDLVVNRVDAERRRASGAQIAATGRSELGANLRYAGSLAEDESVAAAEQRGVPVMQLFPGARFCQDVHGLIASLFASEPASATRAIALAHAPAPTPSLPIAEPCTLHAAESPSPLRSLLPGRCLRERREQLGIDLAALHERTMIQHRYLEAIEAEDFDALPPEVIAREYVRQVAQALGLSDPAEHAQRFVEKARERLLLPRRVVIPEVMAEPVEADPSEVDPDADLPVLRVARVERSAIRSAISAAFERALRASGARSEWRAEPRIELPTSSDLPSAEDLLAEFDAEPEIAPARR